jgi:hypothetical protein
MRFALTATIILAASAIAPAVALAQTAGAGPYYATPSWDQQLPGATRFVVLTNWVDGAYPSGGAAVLDRETGLVWERSPSADNLDWTGALTHCNQSRTGGRLGWKLPSIQELNSINDPAVTTLPFVPAGHPFVINVGPLAAFWSSTTWAFSSAEALQGNFAIDLFPRTIPGTKAVGSAHAWCVRGGAGADVQ